MVRLLLLGALCVLFVTMGVSAQDSELGEFSSLGSACNFGYNPWERWNAFASENIGESSAPVSYFFTGRTASGGDSYFRPIVAMAVGSSIHSSGTGDNSTVWSATAGGDFFLSGGGTGFGGVEASGSVTLEATTIHGDVNSVKGPVSLGAKGNTYATAVLGDVRASTIIVGDGSMIYGTKHEGEVPTLSVQLSQVSAYLEKESDRYFGMSDSVASSEYHNDGTKSRVVLHSGLNVLSWTMEQIDAISPQLNIEGDATGILVINVAGDMHTIRLPKICFDDECLTQPEVGRVLFNFHEATQFEITLNSVVYASVLAPKAAVSILSGGLWGNVFAKQLAAQSEQGRVVNIIHLPWSDDNDCTTAPPHAPTPGSPPQCGASCAWVELLNFDPWQMWNLFSLGDIGTQELPFGSVIQGRTAALGNAWFSAITLHNGASSASSSGSSSSSSEVNEWSVTVGGNFTLLGGSVRRGGVEAGKNILVQAADVSGGLTAVTGTVTIGTENNAATIKGKARAATNVFFSAGSSADGGVAVGPEGLALSADIEGVAEYFKKQSLAYSTAHSAPNSISFSPSDSTPNDIIVDLHAGVNYINLTPSAFSVAQRLQLTGNADGVLVINVAGKTIQMDGLDVYENGWTNTPTKGRVLVNFFEATNLTVNWGSGSFSILAPLADVLYKSGTFAGNWIVGSVKSQWAGGTQISELAWVAPCEPDC